MGYRKLLNSHGLHLRYDDALRFSQAMKVCGQDIIYVWRDHGVFTVGTFGKGKKHDYFVKEAHVLHEALKQYGDVELKIHELSYRR